MGLVRPERFELDEMYTSGSSPSVVKDATKVVFGSTNDGWKYGQLYSNNELMADKTNFKNITFTFTPESARDSDGSMFYMWISLSKKQTDSYSDRA